MDQPLHIVGRVQEHIPHTGSTNDDIKQRARDGADEGLVLSTDEQTGGRGRRGRSWVAPAGSSLLLSVLLRPTWLAPADGFLLTILGAVAGAEAIEETTGLPVGLKWPNDLEIDRLKIGGVLAETEVRGNTLRWCVLGIGININWNPADIPELASTATSLAHATGQPIERTILQQALLQRLDQHYLSLRNGTHDKLFQAWQERLTTLNQRVRVEGAITTFEGIVEDVTGQGALIVRDMDGIAHIVTAGDVSVRRT